MTLIVIVGVAYMLKNEFFPTLTMNSLFKKLFTHTSIP